jgi:hypothetical protein
MFTLFAPRKITRALAAVAATVVMFSAALLPFISAAEAVPTTLTTR